MKQFSGTTFFKKVVLSELKNDGMGIGKIFFF